MLGLVSPAMQVAFFVFGRFYFTTHLFTHFEVGLLRLFILVAITHTCAVDQQQHCADPVLHGVCAVMHHVRADHLRDSGRAGQGVRVLKKIQSFADSWCCDTQHTLHCVASVAERDDECAHPAAAAVHMLSGCADIQSLQYVCISVCFFRT